MGGIMKTSITFVIFLTFISISCGDKSEKDISTENHNVIQNSNSEKQLNISILLDLSDRLIQDVTPSPRDRDLEIVKTIVGVFKSDMETKGAFNAKGKIRVLFNPAPSDPRINNIAQDLKENLAALDVKQKKKIYDTIDSSFQSNLKKIYELTLDSKKWVGSDIWRFFKNDVKDYCIDNDPDYRNILIILTDGYIYHEQSVDRIKNRTTYITGKYLQSEGFRNSDWRSKFDSGDYGLISSSSKLQNLDVLVLEVNASAVYKNDEDIIRAFLSKWFNEMSIKQYKIYNTDLPSNTSQRIINFFNR